MEATSWIDIFKNREYKKRKQVKRKSKEKEQ